MAELVLGPMLRYVSDTEATVWVEVDRPCSVEILHHRASTFEVEGHHYAIVAITGLAPASTHEYEVRLDGERRWPAAAEGFPPSRISTLPESGPIRLVFGSCRVTAPDSAPYTLSPDQDALGVGADALIAYALRMARDDPMRSAPERGVAWRHGSASACGRRWTLSTGPRSKAHFTG